LFNELENKQQKASRGLFHTEMQASYQRELLPSRISQREVREKLRKIFLIIFRRVSSTKSSLSNAVTVLSVLEILGGKQN
jgi:hypothetical protein